MNPSDVAILDLELFSGVSRALSFALKRKNPVTGDIIGPYDLTGWTVAVVFRKAIHNDTLTLLSSQPANASGSYCDVTDAVNGEFNFSLSATELNDPSDRDGDWRIEIRQGDEAQILVRGYLRFIPFVSGGDL